MAPLASASPAASSATKSAYPLITPRLSIAPLTAAHRDALIGYRSVPDVARYQPWDPARGETRADEIIALQPKTDLPAEGGWIQLALTLREAAEDFIGDVAIHNIEGQPDTYEIGASLALPVHGRGLATEAVEALVEWLFDEQGAHRVFGQCDARNIGMQKVFEKLGWRHEGRAVEGDWFKGQWTSLDTYAILAREWRARR